ncbi:MAG: sialidase family protein [Planctomycetota bacterium]
MKTSQRALFTVAMALAMFTVSGGRLSAEEKTAVRGTDGPLSDQLKPASLEMQQVFQRERFPNVVVATDGTLVASFGTSSLRVRRSTDGGKTWGEMITVAKPGFQGGGLTVDETSGHILAFVEKHHPPAEISIYRSGDHGKTWKSQNVDIAPDSKGNAPSMHMNDRGITLRYGKHKGRLIRPTRWYAGKNDRSRWPHHYTNAMYSDDGGKSWKTSDPFPENGTGEACIIELSDGRLYYNSRVHWQENPKNRRRRSAISTDGGQTWKNFRIIDALPDGPQDTNYGCMAGLARLAVQGKDILVYSNCDSERGRKQMTVWASFDGGKTWPVKRLLFKGRGAYSSMTSGRPGTATAGWIYLHFEGGPKGASTVAKFNLRHIAEGQATGDGKIPDWFPKS